MTRGGYGQRSDHAVIGAPLLNAGGDFDDPACARPEHRHLPWDYQEKGATAGLRGQGNPLADPAVREAITVCGGCVHLLACGEHAIRNRERVGLWGATTPGQREAMWRAMDGLS